jgi:DNA-binding CsgD family transcriptional regulator
VRWCRGGAAGREGAPAFWPWVQLVCAYVQAADPATLRRDMGAGAADVAQLVPAVGECLPGLPALAPTELEVASFVAAVAGVEPSAELAAALHRETDGNPFFVTEVVRLLASQGRLDHPETGSPVLADGLPEGVRAVVAQRLGRLSDDCRRLLEVAAVLGRDFGLRVLQPASGLDPGRLLQVLEEAAATAQELGIHGLGERAGALLSELAAPAAPAWPAGLTGREVQVLRLIAAGCSNRAIAEALYISPNTVLRHVSHIFAKTGVANRAEAAAYATRQGLTG